MSGYVVFYSHNNLIVEKVSVAPYNFAISPDFPEKSVEISQQLRIVLVEAHTQGHIQQIVRQDTQVRVFLQDNQG